LVARYLSGSSGAGLGLLNAAKAGMSVILEKGLDHKLEYEADLEGVKYAIRAGYKPEALIAFLERLHSSKNSQHLDAKVLEKTHPSNIDRQERIKGLLAELKSDQIIGAEGIDRFSAIKKNLPKVKKKSKKEVNK
jgi:predicted Zn-dependent protease